MMFEVFYPYRDDWGNLQDVRKGPIYTKFRQALAQANRLPNSEIRLNGRTIWMKAKNKLILPSEQE